MILNVENKISGFDSYTSESYIRKPDSKLCFEKIGDSLVGIKNEDNKQVLSGVITRNSESKIYNECVENKTFVAITGIESSMQNWI